MYLYLIFFFVFYNTFFNQIMVEALQSRGVEVYTGVDATQLSPTTFGWLKAEYPTKIVFNFPHTGFAFFFFFFYLLLFSIQFFLLNSASMYIHKQKKNSRDHGRLCSHVYTNNCTIYMYIYIYIYIYINIYIYYLLQLLFPCDKCKFIEAFSHLFLYIHRNLSIFYVSM